MESDQLLVYLEYKFLLEIQKRTPSNFATLEGKLSLTVTLHFHKCSVWLFVSFILFQSLEAMESDQLLVYLEYKFST